MSRTGCDTGGFETHLSQTAAAVERRLDVMLSAADLGDVPPRLLAAMRHACLGGGKRIRPFLVMESARLFGVPQELALETACAVEFVHCYSLIHDDLPAMDDDDLRRGRPTVHRAFDEATAILAGDSLQALAFARLGGPAAHPDPAVRSALVTGLAGAAGAAGMCGGQQLDLEAEANATGTPLKTLSGVELIQRLKTGAIIRFAAEAGAILGQADASRCAAMRDYGSALGAAFQIADDLLDAEGAASVVGKATAKDAAAGKATFVSLLGIEGARSRLTQEGRRAEMALEALQSPGRADTAMLAGLVAFNARRRS